MKYIELLIPVAILSLVGTIFYTFVQFAERELKYKESFKYKIYVNGKAGAYYANRYEVDGNKLVIYDGMNTSNIVYIINQSYEITTQH